MKNILAIIFIMSIKMAFSQPTDIERLRPQIDKYLSLVMANGFEKYGFYSADDIYNVQLGEPIQTIEMEQNFYYDEFSTGDYCMQNVNEFRIPLIVNDTIRAFAVVAEKKGKWVVVDFGASILAQRVDKCYRDYGIHKKQKVKMLRDTYSSIDYIELSEDDFVIVEENEGYENSTNKLYKPKLHHHSKNDVKHQLYQHYKAANHQQNNQRIRNHERQ